MTLQMICSCCVLAWQTVELAIHAQIIRVLGTLKCSWSRAVHHALSPFPPVMKVEGNCYRGTWEVLDFGDVVVHVMSAEKREYYDLEGFYGAAEEVCNLRVVCLLM